MEEKNMIEEDGDGMFSERLTGEASVRRELEALSVSQRLVRSVSQKLRKKNHRGEGEEEDDSRGVSLKCLTLYGMGGGCKVGADTGEEFADPSGRRRSSSASEEGKGYRPICTGFDCFSYGMREKFWKKNSRKDLELEDLIQNSRLHMFLPDDVLELCLVRLPLTSLMNARLVCKKWRCLTTTPRFLQLRREVFKMIFYVVGGCSSLTHFGRVDRSSFRTHKGVWAFSPLTKSWRKIASMRYARSMPVLGISEVRSDFSVVHSHQHRQERRFPRSRIAGVSDVYEDPHRFSLRRQYRNAFDEYEPSSLPNRKSHKFTRQKSGQSNMKDCKRFVLIAVGGLGSWDEPLDSGEIYDPITNKWTRNPEVAYGFWVICNGMFYVYSETDKLMGYDIERGFWMAIQSSPFPPRVQEYYPKLVSCNGQLFMLSVSWCEWDGQIGQRNKAVRKLWELDLMYLNWTEVSVHPDAPMDWNAAYLLQIKT
ncbi:F-box/kelch-repeat protein [Populus alba x Populus x berolinensis]|nr:F-box/kelch-repeat protein [Populus alba x Populus x berolinensis]